MISMIYIYIFVAGGLGVLLRYSCTQFVNVNMVFAGQLLGFSLGTVTVNMLGCMMAGGIYAFFNNHEILSPTLRLVLLTGFLGGFTTFSAFIVDIAMLYQHGQILPMLLYIMLTLSGCILGFAIIYYVIKISW